MVGLERLHYGTPPGTQAHRRAQGFKMVKWIAAIELVRDFADLGGGEGGYDEDHEFHGYRVPI
jgi:hypothetical protein